MIAKYISFALMIILGILYEVMVIKNKGNPFTDHPTAAKLSLTAAYLLEFLVMAFAIIFL